MLAVSTQCEPVYSGGWSPPITVVRTMTKPNDSEPSVSLYFSLFLKFFRDFTANSLPDAARQRVGYTDNTHGAVVPITGEHLNTLRLH